MPVIKPGSSGTPQRTTFRPPWVKDGPEPLPLPAAPWTLSRTRDHGNTSSSSSNVAIKPSALKSRGSISGEGSAINATENAPGSKSLNTANQTKNDATPARKQSKITIIPSMPVDKIKENGVPEETKANKKSNIDNKKTGNDVAKVQTTKSNTNETHPMSMDKSKQNKAQEVKVGKESKTSLSKNERAETTKGNKSSEVSKEEFQPPKPPEPPVPPPAPPVPSNIPPEKLAKLEILRSRPRKRPDWGRMMKEVEMGKKLKHVQCNDRSSPLIPKVKVKNQFMYESERPTVHNQLLKEIQTGVNLKKVQTNDRSKPQLEGLRKFRRQLTVEEQIQKAAELEEVQAEPDELDDIDKVRDDLQSTKQMLALELRNKEAVERENKRLQARILNLEVELEKEKASKKPEDKASINIKDQIQEETKKVKQELADSKKFAENMEKLYHETADLLDITKTDLEAMTRKYELLEKKLAQQSKVADRPLTKQPSAKKVNSMKDISQKANNKVEEKEVEEEEDEESEYEEETETEESEEEEDGENQEALQERRNIRELKLLTTKLKALKDKESVARKERKALREQLKKEQKLLKEEKKRYKSLQKEVDKMAKLMKDDDEDDEDEDKDEDDNSDENEEDDDSESESESESEESDEDESDGDLPPDSPIENKKNNLTQRSKRHENCLAALKKGNYILKANIERFKDELFKQKEMSLTLQEDLNSVLAELG